MRTIAALLCLLFARCWPLNLRSIETWPTPSPRTNGRPWMSMSHRGQNHPVVFGFMAARKHRAKKLGVQKKPQALIDKGFVFVCDQLSILAAWSLKEMTGDVAKAIRWVHDHAKDYRGDPNSIIVMGHRAGHIWPPWFAPTTVTQGRGLPCRSSKGACRSTSALRHPKR